MPVKAPARVYTKRDMAMEMNCSTSTIQFFERKGLLPPADFASTNYALWSQKAFDQLRRNIAAKIPNTSVTLGDMSY